MAWGAAVAFAGLAAACDGVAAGPGDRGDAVEATREPVDRTPVHASLSGPPTGLVPPAPGHERLVGVVTQQLPAGGYTYLEIEPEHGELRWVVTMRRGIRAGDRVRVDSFGSRPDFYSRRLDRSFAELVFGTVEILG